MKLQQLEAPRPPNGIIAYRGPSQITGEPIVAILTGTARPTDNTKTGDMLQLWILDAKHHPVEASEMDEDDSVCGDCPLRMNATGHRSCYVDISKAPAGIYNAYTRGRYPMGRPSDLQKISGRHVRLGAYGDPAAIPAEILHTPASTSKGHTGYTHAWRYCDPKLSQYVMASVESVEDGRLAQAAGWRTFRAGKAGESIAGNEFNCHAAAESGKRLTCAECRACDGGSPPKASITIVQH